MSSARIVAARLRLKNLVSVVENFSWVLAEAGLALDDDEEDRTAVAEQILEVVHEALSGLPDQVLEVRALLRSEIESAPPASTPPEAA